jgi:DNA-binding beta-propeller fold protein YncE
VNVGGDQFSVKGYFDTRLPQQSYFGAEPEALALSPDGSRLYVANAISDAVAVMDTTKLTGKAAKEGMVEPIGFMPTEWMPIHELYRRQIVRCNGEGQGDRPE